MEDVELRINRDEEDNVTGFTLMGVGNTDAEAYCISFVRAQQLGRAAIHFKGSEMIFSHQGVSLDDADSRQGIYGSSEGGDFRAKVADSDKEQLESLLNSTGPYSESKIHVKFETARGKGFTVYIK
ncbi:MAG: hypothetical protein ACD_8C00021G0011 [uncultured bacterium]|nr:MAG: hypothetical protein ACD_8C00021G0011 [uncultured bacterium]